MATKKQEPKPVTKTWIWLKSITSKALQDLKSEYGIDRVKLLCGKWLETERQDADGFHLADKETMVLRGEVAHVRASIVCPADVPATIAKIDRAKHVWAKIPHPEITIRTTKRKILERLGEILDKANELGTENAKLKNQIASLKKKDAK